MQNKKIIAVVGSTGTQGSGLVKAILNDPNGDFAVRAITRDTNSEKAKEYAKSGAEVVSADVENYGSLKKALEGAYGAYFVSFFAVHLPPEKEMAQAKNMAQAAKDAGLQHVIWSTLEDTRKWIPLTDNRMPTLHEKYKVPHFDSKGESNQYFIDAGVPTTFFHTSFYWDNLVSFGMGPKKGKDGQLTMNIPVGKKKIGGIASEDIGKCAYGVFKRGSDFIGKNIGCVGEFLTCEEMAEKLSKALGEKVVYNDVPLDAYRGFEFPGAQELGNMFQFYQDCEDVLMSHRSAEFSKELNPELKNFDAWCAENAKKIPLE